MKQFIYLASSIILLIVIAGCGGGGGGETSGSAPTTPFLGGTNGLKIEFLTGEPPDEVTDGGQFDFQAIVSLKNEGEFDLKRDQVKVSLVGILPEDFGTSYDALTDKNPEDDLSPKIRDSEGNILNAIVTDVTFPDTDSFFNFDGEIAGNIASLFRAEVCYKYQTKAASRICVLRDLINLDTDDICDPSETKQIFSSSSPLQVTSFKQTVSSVDMISFSFDVVHSGSGDVFKEGDSTSSAGDCPRDFREKKNKENRVLVTVNTGLSNLRCSGLDGDTTGFINIHDGRRTVTCRQPLDSGRNDFETNVDITLDFNYLDFTETEVLVKHLIGS